VRLTAAGKTLTSPLKVTWDPRETAPQADLETQLAFALRIRDTTSKLTGLVHSLQSIKEQLHARAKTLESRKAESGIAELLKAGDALIGKIDVLEAKLHNPKAEVTYDILAERGGARLYSRLSPLQMWAVSGDSAPTQGMQQVLAEYEKELAPLEQEAETLLSKDLADINARAKSLGLEFVQRTNSR